MKFSIAAATTLLGTASFAAPSARGDETTYQIKDFTTKQPDGTTISTLSFRILATNGGTLDFKCSPYDPVTRAAVENFEIRKVYFCGEHSFFSFSYVPKHDTEANKLVLWQAVSDTKTLGGTVSFEDPICCGDGGSAKDGFCAVPDDVYISITMQNWSN